MAEFVQVASASEVPEPGKMLVEVDDRLVALFHVGGEWFAIDDVCTHDGGPLAEGKLEDHTIACPRHGAKFDIRTGAALTMPATKPTASHEVKVEGGEVYVKLRHAGGGEQESGVRNQESAAKPLDVAVPPASGGRQPAGNVAAAPSATQDNGAAAATSAAVSEDRLREELKQVVDPELFVNIIDLGLVYALDLKPAAENKTDVQVEMTLTSPACPAGPQLIQQTHQALGRLPGIGQVNVRLVMDPPWTPDRMTDEARDQLGIF
jgi:metal-sulfur cluster biosynthetic enzyme/nitrite reductase/ring-hydroxylating ferredoxin subunit